MGNSKSTRLDALPLQKAKLTSLTGPRAAISPAGAVLGSALGQWARADA